MHLDLRMYSLFLLVTRDRLGCISLLQVHDSNAQVFVIALGENYDEDQLKAIATGDGDETIYYAENARVVVEDIREIALQICTMHVIG